MGCCSCNSTPFLFSQEALNILFKKSFLLYLKRGESLTCTIGKTLTYGIRETLTPFEVIFVHFNNCKFKAY